MPRCLDIIFNSITSCQAKKSVFKPDGKNRFGIQTDKNAESECSKTPKDSDTALPQRTSEHTKIVNVNDNTYAVFGTYVEIYNNSVHDLLDDMAEYTLKSKLSVLCVLDRQQSVFMAFSSGAEVMYVGSSFVTWYRAASKE